VRNFFYNEHEFQGVIMRIGFYQFAPRFGEPEQNLNALVAALAGAEADLIVAPELALSGYLFTRREEVEEMASCSTARLSLDRKV
jgi:predicted amidohydrolase